MAHPMKKVLKLHEYRVSHTVGEGRLVLGALWSMRGQCLLRL